MTRQEQKQEAIARMRMLKLHQNAIDEFEKEDKLNLSELRRPILAGRKAAGIR
jgi:hypothetical protein